MINSSKRFFIVAIIISILVCPMASAETFSIRNGITFGMTKEEVKKAENMKVSIDGKNSYFMSYQKVEIAGIKNSTLEYLFEKNKLIGINMLLNTDAAKLTLEKEYRALSSSLKDKYGKPLGYKNGKTADLTSSYLSAQITTADLDKLLGGKLGYKISYEEWLIPIQDGKVKIEHVLFTAKSNKECAHSLYYTFFSNRVQKDI